MLNIHHTQMISFFNHIYDNILVIHILEMLRFTNLVSCSNFITLQGNVSMLSLLLVLFCYFIHFLISLSFFDFLEISAGSSSVCFQE